MAYYFVEVMGKVKIVLKYRMKVMRLISDVGRDTSWRVYIKTLNIVPLSCTYIMKTIYRIKMNIVQFEQNSGIIVIHVIVQIFNPSSLGLIFLNSA